jgi:UDP-N-acetylmuramoylalanine--D-glutamate ligase
MNITVIGLARSGFAAAQLAQRLGYRVRVTDACAGAHMTDAVRRTLEEHAQALRARGIWVELGQHTPACLEHSTLVVTSPGVPDNAPPLQWARQRNIPIISEVEFAVRQTTARIVAITGTNGKTTTTSLIGHVLSTAGMPVVVAGNIGQALSGVVEEATAQHTLVLEISSFQLETVQTFRPHVAIWLNLTPDHLDRYKTITAYAAAKARMFRNMTSEDWAVLWLRDRELLLPLLNGNPAHRVWLDETGTWRPTRAEPYGATLAQDELVTHLYGMRQAHGRMSALHLCGAHNAVNVLAACAAARILHVPAHAVEEALRTFHGLPHRLEHVAARNGITFVNDSKATNVDAMLKALETLPAPITLLAGGYDKDGEFAPALPLLRAKVQRAVLFGAARDKLMRVFDGATELMGADTMQDAVNKAVRGAPAGTTVLLAPGCASYDWYNDFEERGVDFRRCVHHCLESLA